MSALMIDNRLNQVLSPEPMTDAEYAEYQYRRAYREGWGRAVDAFSQLACTPAEIELVQQLLDFYLYRLETWLHLPLSQRIPPPEMVLTAARQRLRTGEDLPFWVEAS